ncbi:MAG: outer membrane protein assembly factor BamB, partial [Rubrivivax sp.]
MKRALLITALAASLSGCSTVTGWWNSWFGGEKSKPATLEPLSGGATGRIAWSTKGDSLSFPLSIATPGDRFVVAGTDGSVRALSAEDGRELWRGDTEREA